MPYKYYDFFYSIIISSLSRDMTHVRISELVRTYKRTLATVTKNLLKAEGSKIAHIVETSRVTGNLAGDRNLHKEREVQQNDEA